MNALYSISATVAHADAWLRGSALKQLKSLYYRVANPDLRLLYANFHSSISRQRAHVGHSRSLTRESGVETEKLSRCLVRNYFA